jgi:aspartyl-tRNA(Asn)/glutamyl-tRNA(Gln) amidotransferase subunit A
MADTDLSGLTVVEAAREIDARRLSPVELTDSILQRIRLLDGSLNAYIAVAEVEARSEARSAESEIMRGRYRGQLHGIPIALKDLYDVRGMPTTAGGKLRNSLDVEQDSVVAHRLRRAGAILTGKLNLHEYAFGVTNINPFFGTARNPWDLDRISGGSSGGSGVAVAADLCLAALGSDSGGSIRIPACLCGIVGFKPSYGVVSRRGVYPLSWSLDHAGPMTKTVADTTLIFQEIAGYDPLDPGSIKVRPRNYLDELGKGLKGWKIGILGGAWLRNLDDDVYQNFHNALKVFEGLGATLKRELVIPGGEYAQAVNTAIISAEAAVIHGENLKTQSDVYSDGLFSRLASGLLLGASEYIRAQQVRRVLAERLLELFSDVDLLLLPMVAIPAPRISEDTIRIREREVPVGNVLTRHTGLFNLTGTPAISLPSGFSRDGLPTGIQIAGRYLEDSAVLRAAYAYESMTNWSQFKPNLTPSMMEVHE